MKLTEYAPNLRVSIDNSTVITLGQIGARVGTTICLIPSKQPNHKYYVEVNLVGQTRWVLLARLRLVK